MKRPRIETSIAAYHSLDSVQLTQTHSSIIEALKILKEATTEQIADYLHMPHAQIWKRVSDPEMKDLIYRPGHKLLTSTGRKAFVWKIGKAPEKEPELSGPTVSDFAKDIGSLGQQLLF